jgi:DNA (cytosine-5)-methyltransferase 1
VTNTIGGLFYGYGGLDLAVAEVFNAELRWYADVCKITKQPDGTYTTGHHSPHRGPCAIAAHHHPGVPNLGDVTRIDWSRTPRVTIMTGGSPCTDLSHAGRRAGMTEGTRSNLWVAMREGIATLRPNLVAWENVRGALTASADSELVARPGLLDGVRRRRGEPVLRAAGRVVGDLADLGYDSRWVSLPASGVGAPHERFRIFLLAYQRGDDPAAYA